MPGWPQFSLENFAGRLPRRTGPASARIGSWHNLRRVKLAIKGEVNVLAQPDNYTVRALVEADNGVAGFDTT